MQTLVYQDLSKEKYVYVISMSGIFSKLFSTLSQNLYTHPQIVQEALDLQIKLQVWALQCSNGTLKEYILSQFVRYFTFEPIIYLRHFLFFSSVNLSSTYFSKKSGMVIVSSLSSSYNPLFLNAMSNSYMFLISLKILSTQSHTFIA